MKASLLGCAVAIAAALASLATGGCKQKAAPGLVIVSPHNTKIEEEFEAAFRDWHKSRFDADVTVEWRDIGGSTTVTHYLEEQYKLSDSSGIDLYFGGGAPDHKMLAAKGISLPVELPEEILSKLPAAIGGIEQYDKQGRWYGAAVSCFGIVYNAKLLEEKGLEVPRRWDDLAEPAMFARVAAADPTQSGSARAAYDMIIQSEKDWPAGWAKLLRIFTNCKRFTSRASDVPADVADGEVLAGAAIDFYGYDQIAASGDSVGFTIVAGTTAFTPDPIAMLKGAPHPQEARRFIEFVLSEKGQALWCLPVGAENGPKTSALYRQPIRRDIYEKYAGKMLAPLVDPFQTVGDFKLDEAAAAVRISRLLGPLMKAAAIDNRDDMTAAWKAIIDAGMPADLLAELAKLPTDLDDQAKSLETARKLADAKDKELITGRWQQFFRDKYRGIIQRAGR